MTFYIKPPQGTVSLYKLYEEAEVRLQYLVQINQHWGDATKISSILTDNPSIASKSECLIEGSRKDQISHFILRFACVESRQLQHFFIEAETQLFEYRLKCGGAETFVRCLTALKRHIQHSLKHQKLSLSHERWLQELLRITRQIITSGMMLCSERQSCSHCLRVPWTMVPILVKNRTVDIIKGEAEIECRQLVHLLSSVFQGTLEFGIKQLSLYGGDLFDDKRLESVKRSLYRIYRRIQSNGLTLQKFTLTHRDIETEAPFFPLCMQHLHSILSRNNRLRHHERFKYSLFLKDIGLPLKENIRFWEDFYSKPHCTSASGCTHSWAGNDRNRYVYSIKHFYGLEGGRKNYTSHSCASLQECHPQPTEVRGCPFTSTNAEDVSTLIKKFVPHSTNILDNVMKEVVLGRASAACQNRNESYPGTNCTRLLSAYCTITKLSHNTYTPSLSFTYPPSLPFAHFSLELHHLTPPILRSHMASKWAVAANTTDKLLHAFFAHRFLSPTGLSLRPPDACPASPSHRKHFFLPPTPLQNYLITTKDNNEIAFLPRTLSLSKISSLSLHQDLSQDSRRTPRGVPSPPRSPSPPLDALVRVGGTSSTDFAWGGPWVGKLDLLVPVPERGRDAAKEAAVQPEMPAVPSWASGMLVAIHSDGGAFYRSDRTIGRGNPHA
ncbi:DNA primase large subunit [Penaeus vannamei]|uniref:DNA primase large subunit n=1 Tax=Penaeus vannamei TaxID=6689 RepID=A0A3R7MKL2_PENVA|nr:DNA primase large subunit [Penaeus vannamei]